jgi:uncharacterized membrane protein YkvA (DUF1232 family)
MTLSDLKTLLKEATLSPEELGKRMGVSGMTVRRWLRRRGPKTLEPLYARSLESAIRGLLADGLLNQDSRSAQSLARECPETFQLSLRHLGLSLDSLQPAGRDHTERLMGLLAKIGESPQRAAEVRTQEKKISFFSRLGKEWASWISTLKAALRSSRLTSAEKLPAYGALFYLICPFDLIPDHIPVLGLLDDAAVLSLAAGYYAKKLGGGPHA